MTDRGERSADNTARDAAGCSAAVVARAEREPCRGGAGAVGVRGLDLVGGGPTGRGLILVRLALGLVPVQWRQWASNRAVAVLAFGGGAVVGHLVSLPALGVAAGLAGLVLVWQLRAAAWPRWARWAVAGTSAALVVGCGLAVWLAWLADADRREANERRDREQQVADLLPETPNEALNRLVSNLCL